MRISDWSSDVCSSDLPGGGAGVARGRAVPPGRGAVVAGGVAAHPGGGAILARGSAFPSGRGAAVARGIAEHPGCGAEIAASLGAVADRQRIVAGGVWRREAASVVAVHGDAAARRIELAEIDRVGGGGAVGAVAAPAPVGRGAD